MTVTDESLASDLIYGAKVIGEYVGADARQANYMLETGKLPGFKLGNKWVARKSALKERFQSLEKEHFESLEAARAT
jgi:hypothetical protein